MGDEVGGVSAVKGVHLGGVGVWGGDGRTSSELATSLIGVVAGTGVTWSALGVGSGVGGPRGVVVVEVLPSTDFRAKGEGAREFSCPLAARRGGTEIQAFSFSLGIIIGKMTRVRIILPVSGSSSSISWVLNSMVAGVETSLTWGIASQWESTCDKDLGATVSGTSRVGGMSDPSLSEGAAGTDDDKFGWGETELEPMKGARDNFSHAGIRELDGEEGPSRRAVSWSVNGDRGKSRRPVDRRTCSSSFVILGMAIYNSRVCTIITFCFQAIDEHPQI